MKKSPLLDTHVWIWWMLGDTRLSDRERTVLDDLPSGQRPRLCDISLWEVAMLVQLGRLQLDDALEDWLRIAASPATVEVMFSSLPWALTDRPPPVSCTPVPR